MIEKYYVNTIIFFNFIRVKFLERIKYNEHLNIVCKSLVEILNLIK